jgi:hypothetical protein
MLAYLFRFATIVTVLLATWHPSVRAEVTKLMLVCKGELCPFFQTSIKPPPGWHEDAEAGHASQATILIPDGSDYGSAGALIYAIAKPNPGGKRRVDQSIAEHITDWKKKVSDATVTPLPDLPRDSNGPAFKRNLFAAPSLTSQPYEIVCVTDDKDKDGNAYIVYVVLTALSENDLNEGRPALETALKAY